jgi:hypothetical protein
VGQDATRRGVLAATAVLPLLAAGCRGVSALGTPPTPQADVTLARAAIAAETLMIRRYEKVIAAVPSLTARLRPLLSQHEDHLARLRYRLVDPGASAPAAPTGTPSTGLAAVGAVPASSAAALAFLRHAEDAAAATLANHLRTASPSFAQLLASIAASEATHALVLGKGRWRA